MFLPALLVFPGGPFVWRKPVKAAILIDGGYLRVLARNAQQRFDPDFIEQVALACLDPCKEQLLKILYYDCPPYSGSHFLPVSGNKRTMEGTDGWLKQLSYKDFFAVRLGVLKFRGYRLKQLPHQPGAPLTDDDFDIVFEQKGVDMRIGLDIASMCEKRIADRVILVSGDTDCIPAMKHARKAGLQVVLINLPGAKLARELRSHSDLLREVAWPAASKTRPQPGTMGIAGAD